MTTPQEQSGAMARSPGLERSDRLDTIPGLSWTTGADGSFDSVGGRWLEWTGQDPSQALGDGWLEALASDDMARVRALWRSAIAEGSFFTACFRVGPGLDGRILPVIAFAEPVRNDSGRPVGWTGLAIRDLNADPQTSPRTNRNANDCDDDPRLEEPLDGSSSATEDFAIFWIASDKGQCLASVSPSCERLLGRSVAELTGQPCSWVSLAHPDDRPRVAEAYARRVLGEPITLDYRLLRPDGSTARVRDRVLTALTRSMGDPDRIFGVLEDVEGGDEPDPTTLSKPSTEAPAADPSALALATLIDEVGDLFLVVNRDGRCQSASDQTAQRLGTDSQAILGQRLDEFFPELACDPAAEQLQHVWKSREPVSFEVFSGQLKLWLEFRAAPTADGLGLIARDVTEQRDQRLALIEVEERYRLSSEAISGLIYDWRVETGIVHRSPGLLGLLGIPPEDAEPTNQWWRNRVHPDDLPKLRDEMAELIDNPDRKHYRLEYRIRHRDGHYIDVWDKGFCLRDPQGRLVRVVGSTIDISERRRAEQALHEADRMKNEFLGILAHELRNPLSPILASAQALRSGIDDPDGKLTAIIERQARHMSRLVEDLLDISRISHGKVLVRPEPLNLSDLVRQTLDSLSELFREKQLTLQAEFPETAVPVLADTTRLAQCVGNLIHNASKFTDPGGMVTVRVGTDGASALVEVQDTGIGIAPDVLPTLFHAYRQADRSIAQSGGGLGLGLALVKNLIELQGGRVDVSSDGEGHGSTFRLILPLQDASEPMAPAQNPSLNPGPPTVATVEQPPENPPRALRLLVVDDRPDMAHVLSRLLRTEGHLVTLATDARQALDLARAERPEVVISDIGLPGPIDGYDLARALRSDPETSKALLIAVTGYARPDDRTRALQSGFDEHLTKPLDFVALCHRLTQFACRPDRDNS